MTASTIEPIVYVVDDDPSFRRLASTSLAGAALCVRCFEDGLSFLQRAERLSTAAVLLDFGMPYMNGLEVLRTLQSENSCWSVVLVTAAADVPLAVRAMKFGAIDFLPKPCPSWQLVSAAQAALVRSQELVAAQQAQRQIDGRWTVLSARERDVSQHSANGHPTKTVAKLLGISAKTVEFHRTRAYRKLGVRYVVELAHLAPSRTN